MRYPLHEFSFFGREQVNGCRCEFVFGWGISRAGQGRSGRRNLGGIWSRQGGICEGRVKPLVVGLEALVLGSDEVVEEGGEAGDLQLEAVEPRLLVLEVCDVPLDP